MQFICIQPGGVQTLYEYVWISGNTPSEVKQNALAYLDNPLVKIVKMKDNTILLRAKKIIEGEENIGTNNSKAE